MEDSARGNASTEWLASALAVPGLERRLNQVTRTVTDSIHAYRAALTDATVAQLEARGKGVRGALLLTASELGGTRRGDAVKAASACELLQLGSIVHDDIIEAAPVRRGQPTVVERAGVPHALVVGDLLLSRAGELAAELGSEPSHFLARGMTEMAAGQLLELQDLFDVDRPVERHIAVIRAKTGALFACACRLGAWCGGLSTKDQDRLTTYGYAFGVMYQLLDDLLDVFGDPITIGKPIGNDVGTGVYTVPVIAALQKSTSQRRLRRRLRSKSPEHRRLAVDIVKEGGADLALNAVREWVAQSSAAVKDLPRSTSRDALAAFPAVYANAVLDPLGLAREHP